MAKKGQKFSNYDDKELRELIIKEKIEKGKTYPYLSKKYGIPEGTINTWVYQYRHKGEKIEKEKRGRSKHDENIDYKEKYEILKKFLGLLEEVDQEKK